MMHIAAKDLISEYQRGERDFRGSYLARANLGGANLGGANLGGANLQWAYLEGANLQWAYLENANLGGAKLGRANLQWANLEDAKLGRANLEDANLQWANLEGAYLEGAYFEGAYLEDANLEDANLQWANLERAKLEGARLEGARLEGARLEGAYFCGTCLDPLNHIEKISDEILENAGFEVEGDFVVGYRTEVSTVTGTTKYIPGAVYTAPYFSTDTSTACHPGLYFAPLEWMKKHYQFYKYVRVAAVNGEIVHARGKWRAKRLIVLPLGD
jgi:hypothetical protein